jgi:hypothetical protein
MEDKMKKNCFSIGTILIIIVSIVACAPSKATVDTTGPTATARSGISSSLPAPYGTEIHADRMKFVITGLVRPADDIVKGENKDNPQAPTGQEYMYVSLGVTCEETTDKQCTFITDNFKALGSDASLKDVEYFVGHGLIKSGMVYGESTIFGSLPFIVNKGDANILLVYKSFSGDKYYFSLRR